MTNWVPTTKITAVGATTALGTLIAAIATRKGYPIDAPTGAAIVGGLATAIGYLVPNRAKQVEPIGKVDQKLAAAYVDELRRAIAIIQPETPEQFAALSQAAELLMVEARREAEEGFTFGQTG